MHTPDLRAKLDIIKLEYAERNNGATLLDKDIATMAGVAPPMVTGWVQGAAIPPARVVKLVDALERAGVNIETEWLTLPLAQFKDRLRGVSRTTFDHPRCMFGSLAGEESFIAINAEPLHPGHVLGMGPRPPAYDYRPVYRIGTNATLTIDMPFSGRLTIIDANETDGSWQYYCLDPFTHPDRRHMEQVRWTLPDDGRTIPFNPPEGENALIAVITAKPLNLPWQRRTPDHSVIRVEPAELAQVVRQLEGRPDTERSVSLLEYKLAD